MREGDACRVQGHRHSAALCAVGEKAARCGKLAAGPQTPMRPSGRAIRVERRAGEVDAPHPPPVLARARDSTDSDDVLKPVRAVGSERRGLEDQQVETAIVEGLVDVDRRARWMECAR